MLIERVHIAVGDDAIAIKSGLDWHGRRYGRPSRNVVVRDSVLASQRLAIGSEASGGVHDVLVENVTFGAAAAAAASGSDVRRGRGGGGGAASTSRRGAGAAAKSRASRCAT